MEKKKEMFVIIGSLLVIILSVTLAYFTVQIVGKGKEISASSADLKITFSSGSGNISSSNIEPGWSSGTSTFTVKNESKDTYKYNIVIKDLVNTFVTTGYLQYKITSADGGYNMSKFQDIPKSTAAKDEILAYSVEIAKGKTHSYSIEFKYFNSSNDQSDDMGKELSGTLYIEKGTLPPTLAEKLLADNPTIKTRTAFNTVFTETNIGTLYKATESIAGGTAKDVYYFAGDAKNNWVKFAGFYWRIIRTNHDGSVRLLYSGTSPDTTEGYIAKSAFNSSSNDSMYVGYMYGTSGSLDNNRTNKNNSAIKGVLDSWYSTNLSSYSKYISTEAVYCNDRELASGSTYNNYTLYFYKKVLNDDGSYASYDCDETKDAFSGSNTEAKLTYPIALMTADEAVIAGCKAGEYCNLWYNRNSVGGSITGSAGWWLLTPDSVKEGIPYMWGVNIIYHGGISTRDISYNLAVRPVISIQGDTLYSSGDGSPENPYQIVYN